MIFKKVVTKLTYLKAEKTVPTLNYVSILQRDYNCRKGYNRGQFQTL